MYDNPTKSTKTGYAFRYGRWKYVAGGISCNADKATFNCSQEQLYDMDTDYVEDHNLADTHPDILAAIAANFTAWYDSIHDSIQNESKCGKHGGGATFPADVVPSSNCTFVTDSGLSGADLAEGSVTSREACCGACWQTKGCVASDFVAASPMHPTFDGITTGGTCHLKAEYSPKHHNGRTACQVVR